MKKKLLTFGPYALILLTLIIVSSDRHGDVLSELQQTVVGSIFLISIIVLSSRILTKISSKLESSPFKAGMTPFFWDILIVPLILVTSMAIQFGALFVILLCLRALKIV